MPKIHPTAIVDSMAELADDVEVGAFAVIRGPVTIGAGTVVHDQSHIKGPTTIGQRCKIGPMAFLGLDPQHSHYNGAPTRLIIGDDCIFREMSNIHRAYLNGPTDATRIGDRCFFMSSSHAGHDSQVGNDVIISSAAMLAGHCVVGDRVFMGGGTLIHQFCRIGRLAILAGNEGISRDVPPFSAVRYGGLKAYNAIGCRRAGLTQSAIHAIRAAFYCLHHNRNMANGIKAIRDTVPMVPEIVEMLEFIAATKRGIHPSVHFSNRGAQDDE